MCRRQRSRRKQNHGIYENFGNRGAPVGASALAGRSEGTFAGTVYRTLCGDRSLLIETVSKTGGHLASNLGSVELTVAMHRVFDSPEDKFVWDVGHQCYTHKILTGRLERFSTLRQENGISGFPKPNESEHDSFISGHSSTAISVACGIAEACGCTGTRSILPLPL